MQVFFVITLVGALGLMFAANRMEERAGHVDPLLEGSWLLRPFRAMTFLINLAERPTERRDDRDAQR
jgi:hypothetical protein